MLHGAKSNFKKRVVQAIALILSGTAKFIYISPAFNIYTNHYHTYTPNKLRTFIIKSTNVTEINPNCAMGLIGILGIFCK